MENKQELIDRLKLRLCSETILFDFRSNLVWNLTNGRDRIIEECASNVDMITAMKFLFNDIAYQTVKIVTGSNPDEAYVKEIVWSLMILNNIIVEPDKEMMKEIEALLKFE